MKLKRPILVIDEKPDLNAKAKSVLKEAMRAAGLKPSRFKWTSVVKEPLPDGKRVTPAMIKREQESLQRKIEKVDPKYMLLLGNSALQAVTNESGIRAKRGKPAMLDKRLYIPINHPNTYFKDEKYSWTATNDLRRLKDCIEFGGIPEERELNYRIVDNHHKVKLMLKDIKGTVSVDLETSRLYPFTTQQDQLIAEGRASVALLRDHKATHGSNNLPKVVAICIGTARNQWIVPAETAGIWNREELEVIVDEVGHRLKDCFTVYHNGKFDILWMKVRFDVDWHVDFDTLLAHYILDENDLHGLKYLAQKMLGAVDWDIDGKDKTEWSAKNAKYAAHDVYYTRKLYYFFLRMLKEDEDVYQVFRWILMPAVQMFMEAEYQGVYINLDQMDDAEAYLREELATATKNLDQWADKAVKVDRKTGKINWGSADQLGDLLFNQLGIDIVEVTKTGKASVSESVLMRIDHPMVGDLLKFRAAQKQLSGFIEGWRPYLDLNGRLHPVFKIHGTVTGRLSCEHPNLQQVPRDKRIRTLITAMPGWTLIEMDLSQIELRIAAELANEMNLLAVFNSGGDPHWQTAIREIERGGGYKKEVIKTAKLDCGKKLTYSQAIEHILKMGGDRAVEVIDAWAETKALKPFFDWKETRKKAKAINFGYLYGMWWKKFKIYARDNYGVTVTDDEAQASREAFFELYPAFPNWHEGQRRFAQVNGYVRSLSGRKRRLPAATGGRDTPARREAQRQAINSPVQSFANELNLMAAIQMRKEFDPSWFRLVGTVHDAVLLEVRNDMVEHVYRRGLEIMSRPKLLKKFEISLSVPIEAEAKIGPWGAGKGIEQWLEATPKKERETPKAKARHQERTWTRHQEKTRRKIRKAA